MAFEDIDVPRLPDALVIAWRGPDGSVWDLTRGTEGVLLDEDVSDFGLSQVTHTITSSGVWTGLTRQNVAPTMGVRIGDDLYGQDRIDLLRRWWTRANSYTERGTLYVLHPNGETRMIAARLRQAPDVTYQHDPSRNTEWVTEPWLLQGTSPWWSGPLQTQIFDREGSTYIKPLYGKDVEGEPRSWGLHISDTKTIHQPLNFKNHGDGEMYLSWHLHGEMKNVTMWMNGYGFSYKSYIEPGNHVQVDTTPGEIRAVNWTASGTSTNVISAVTEALAFPPAPPGDVELKISAEFMGDDSYIAVTGFEQWGSPF